MQDGKMMDQTARREIAGHVNIPVFLNKSWFRVKIKPL